MTECDYCGELGKPAEHGRCDLCLKCDDCDATDADFTDDEDAILCSDCFEQLEQFREHQAKWDAYVHHCDNERKHRIEEPQEYEEDCDW